MTPHASDDVTAPGQMDRNTGRGALTPTQAGLFMPRQTNVRRNQPAPCKRAHQEISPHSDYGFLILRFEVEGMQVLHRGEWITVDPPRVPSSSTSAITCRYLATGGTRVSRTSNPRLSVASLHSLSLESVVRPSPELVDEGPSEAVQGHRPRCLPRLHLHL
ncbi:probable 2-oxoglutarate-dependent dioxygenase SLC1 [Musa acuminata AAA Group]|uniref:probable 2-oxoglutarate-dependent dioxygenase SLC1 n=1 Tax=Musa acuminata AAA Group TaxID=214697 RepID=UPI0031D704DD